MPFIDGTAACSSFVVVRRAACAIAQSEGGLYLVIGADVMSRTVNPFSRNMFPILGDGAGAVLLEAYETEGEYKEGKNFRPECFFSYLDGSKAHLLITPAGGSKLPVTAQMVSNPFDQRHLMFMDGPRVLKEAVRLLVPSRFDEKSKTVLPAAFVKMGFSMDTEEDFISALGQVDVFLFHQANARIVNNVERQLRQYGYKGLIFNNISHYGNTTSASIPLLLEEGWQRGAIKRNTRVMAVVFGGGFTAATVYFRF
ncbi:MAG: hypothetical protein HYT13_00980 [Candidatus Liptonbacteria bacterium]|nr:hypothetical protein [Candidatus Liptonbacteria bacterium]